VLVLTAVGARITAPACDALIVVGWLQGHYLDEHETPIVDFSKLSVESVSLANHCKARPDENVIRAADRVFGK
jgi:hypothetical protein